MIEILELRKNFGRQQVLKGINLTIDSGAITAILGPNGSGKTTLIKSLLGLVLPESGQVSLDGQKTAGRHLYRNQLGYLPQIARFPENLSITELMRMIEDIRKQKGDYLPFVDMFALGPHLKKKIRYLSGGMRQKVNLMLTCMFDCTWYILDEPTSGLDPVALIRLKQWIKDQNANGKSFLVTTHIMDLVEEISEQLVFLLEGKVYFQGTCQKLIALQKEKKLEKAIAKILIAEHA